MVYTFKGGIRVNGYKNTAGCSIENMNAPAVVSISMSQQTGEMCKPVVSAGDKVNVGQIIGRAGTARGVPIHSSVSGTVKSIVEKQSAYGNTVTHIVIENDGRGTVDPSVKPCEKLLTEMDSAEIVDRIKTGGIVELGGTASPVHEKISLAKGKADKIIVNCAESEPFLTGNHRLLVEYPEYVINGLKIILKAVGVTTALIAVESNKPDAIESLKKLLQDSDMISLKIMKTKYPQADERCLVYALTGYELAPGERPENAGCVIFGAETCAAVYNLFLTGMPLVRRIVTVDGDCINNPKNLYAQIGTPVSHLIKVCGGLKKEANCIISGGPMTGVAQWDAETPTVKGTTGVIVLSEDMTRNEGLQSACIRCGRCVKCCPMHLMPSYIAKFAAAGDYERAEKAGVMSCVECGSCTYICPGGVQIAHYIRTSKNAISTKTANSSNEEPKS